MRGLSSQSGSAPEGKAALSAIVITRNEEANIRQCLAAVAFASEIIVVDSGSTDRTVELAEAAGARVLRTTDWPGFGPQKNRALSLATQPWVLSVDADEQVTDALRREILEVVRRDGPVPVWEMPRRSSYCGQFIGHSGWYPDHVVRLFRREAARFSDDLVHERLVFGGRPGRLRSDLLHATYPDLETMLAKLNHYSTAGATTLVARGRRSSLAGAIVRGLWAFLRTYIVRLGFLDGRMGLILAISVAEGTYYKYLKVWLQQQENGRSRGND